MKLLTFVLLFSIYSRSLGQARQYQNLLDTALRGHSELIVCSKPIINIQLDKTKFPDYFYFHRDYANKILDTIMFAQIVKNSKSVDTTLWTDNELKNYLLVNNRAQNITAKYTIQKLRLTDKKQTRFYRNKIRHYNSTDSYSRNLYYFSRPVFDNSKNYAIIQWDNGHSGLGGGGAIVLYQLRDDNWKEVGTIMNWKY